MAEPTRLASLAEIEKACWRELAAAAHDRGHDWRVLALATADHGHADLRSVILREVDREARGLRFFTDSRSPKAAQIAREPRAMLLAWSPKLSWQLRIAAHLELQADGLEVSSRWARLQHTSAAQDYLAPRAPGEALDTWVPDRNSRNHFAVVEAVVDSLDWLELHSAGHRRARFDGEGARWLTP